MKISKSELVQLIRESVEEEVDVSSLNEEELNELLGGLKNLFGTAAKGVGGFAKSAASKMGSGIAGAAGKVGGAIAGAAGKAGQAIKGAYQAGEKKAVIDKVKKTVKDAISAIDLALPQVKDDLEVENQLETMKTAISQANLLLQESLLEKKHVKTKKTVKKA